LDCPFVSTGIAAVANEGHPLIRFDNGSVKRWRKADIQIKDPRTGLVADLQEVLRTERPPSVIKHA
jgi:hypothetical protein